MRLFKYIYGQNYPLVYPSTKHDSFQEDAYIYENVLLALKLDSLNSTHPVVTEVYDPEEILQLFDIITYRKVNQMENNTTLVLKMSQIPFTLISPNQCVNDFNISQSEPET